MDRKLGLLAAAGLMVLASGARAQFSIANPDRGVSAYVWSQDLSGDVGGSSAGATGTGTIAEDGEASFGLTANLGKWELAYTKLDNTNNGRVTSSFNFDGVTYNTNDTFRLDHEVSMFDVFRRWAFVNNDYTNVYGVFGVKVLGMDSTLTGTSGASAGNVSDLDETVPLPMIGAAGRFGPRDGLQGFAGFRWFGLEVGDVDASVLDLSIGVAYQFTGNFRSALGWRKYELDVDVDEGAPTSARIDLENEGLFFEFGMEF